MLEEVSSPGPAAHTPSTRHTVIGAGHRETAGTQPIGNWDMAGRCAGPEALISYQAANPATLQTVEQPLSVTKTVYTVSDFLEWQRAGGLNLRPYFQRGNVWTPKAKSYLVDTLLRGYPIPIIYLQLKTDRSSLRSVRQVIDGQQRLRTILAYIDVNCLDDVEERDYFTLMRTHNHSLAGKSFSELPDHLRDQLATTELSVHVLPPSLSDQVLLQLFARLNSTGLRLNDQEQRNAEYHGEFKTLVYDLSYAQLDRWRDWRAFNPQAIAQMREVEFMSDLIMALVRGPRARTKTSIDSFYKEHDDVFPEATEVARLIPLIFDDMAALMSADSNGDPLRALRTQSWLYSIFCLLMLSRYDGPLREYAYPKPIPVGLTNAQLRRGLVRAKEDLTAGSIPKELSDALRGASTDRSSRALRLDFLFTHLTA